MKPLKTPCIMIIASFILVAQSLPMGLPKSIKLVASSVGSSCCTLLFTREQFRKDSNTIYRLAYELTTDFEVDLSVSAMTYRSFFQLYMRHKFIVDCTSPVAIIFHEDEGTRRLFSRMTHLMPMYDVTWYIYGKAPLEEWFINVNLPFAAVVVAGRVTSPTTVTLYELYRVAPDKPLRTPWTGYWDLNNGSYIHSDIVFNRRFDLEGLVLRTGSTQNEPLHSFQPNERGELELVGYFPVIWQTLGSILNFSSVHYPSIDNVTGIKEIDGKWNGLIGMLLRNEIDVAVSEFIMDSQRTHIVEFTRPLIKSSYQIFFKNAGDTYNWDAVLKPFYYDIWLSVLLWIVVGSCAMSYVHSVCCKLTVEEKVRPEEFSFKNSIFFHLKAICSQGHNAIPSTSAGRILFITAYVVNCVLVPSYSAYLISYITFREPTRPFNNLESFLNDGTYKLQTNAKTAEFTYFSEATNPTLRRIYRELMIKIPLEKFPLNTREALDRVCKDSRLAHFGDMAIAFSYLKEVKLKQNCDIVTLSQDISTIYSSMAVRRNNPYRMLFNHYLQRFEDHGLTGRNLNAAFPKDEILLPPFANVDMKDVMQSFILLTVGILISVTILIMEILYARKIVENKLRTSHHGKTYSKPKSLVLVHVDNRESFITFYN